MAPAVGSAITRDSLAKNIPDSELNLLPSGGHLIFLQCNAIIKIVDWFNIDLTHCGTQFAVDRREVRMGIATIATEFFDRTIGAGLAL